MASDGSYSVVVKDVCMTKKHDVGFLSVRSEQGSGAKLLPSDRSLRLFTTIMSDDSVACHLIPLEKNHKLA